MEKSGFPPRPGEGGEGVAIILGLRPVAGSGGGWEARGRIVAGAPLRTSSGLPRYPAECSRPCSSTWRPPPLFGKLGAGFVYSVHAPPAWPIRGERRRTSLIQRANRRSPCCSAAKACAGEVGQWLGRARADEAAGGLGCSRWRCSVLQARPDPSSLGRLEGARARSASWGLELQGLD